MRNPILNVTRPAAVRFVSRFVLVLGAVAVATTTQAGAAQRPGLKVAPGQTTSGEYPPLVGSAPTSGAVDLDPDTCAQPESVFCDTVAIDVTAPGALSVEVGWADLDGTGTDDIDIILYDAGRNGEYRKLDASESAARPEQVNADVPAGRVNLVVVHYAGANNGYSVSAKMPQPSAAAAARPTGSAVAPATADGTRPGSSTGPARSTSPSKRSSFSARPSAAPEAPVPFIGSGGGTPATSDNRVAANAPRNSDEVALGLPASSSGDLGWIGWVAVGLTPLLMAAAVIFGRRSSSAPLA